MKRKQFIAMYEQRGYDQPAIQQAVQWIGALEDDLIKQSTTIEYASIEIISSYLDSMKAKKPMELEFLLALARMFYLSGNREVYIYFTKLLGGLGVIDSIRNRMIQYAGQEVTDQVFEGLDELPLGTAPQDTPAYTMALMERIQANLSPELYRKILAGNNHGIPAESMAMEKEFYQNSDSLDQYLQERHQRKVDELQSYCDSGQVWYEQIIQQDVVDYVKSNQEILSAVRKGNKLYVTKIPYDTPAFLHADTMKQKRYAACHCTFARESIIGQGKTVPGEWCYCSAGYAKFPFEVIMERDLDVKVLENALDGDPICRFEIDLG